MGIKVMKTEKFKIFVEALEALPDEIKNNEVDMRSNFEPVCGTAGCFAGLISIVANDIPELKNNYSPRDYSPINYSFSDWAMALKDFLGVGLDIWAWENPTIWENTRGLSVYAFNEAWGKKEDEKLIHNDIILHLRKALDNLIKKEKK